MIIPPAPDPDRDLVLERTVDVPPSLVWAAWTQPEHVVAWFTPAPWTTSACDIDLRPGGLFSTTMRSPEGDEVVNVGCYLELIPNERLVWTNVLTPGFRPRADAGELTFTFTAVISLEAHGAGTRYTARVMHGSPAEAARHAEMGFEAGWSTALDQLVVAMRGVTAPVSR